MLLFVALGVMLLMAALAALFPPRCLLLFIQRRYGVRFFYCDACEKKALYLTIDDVPSADTGLILRALKEAGDIKATFFVIESYAKQHPETMRQLITAGHQVANHDAYNRMSARTALVNPIDFERQLASTHRTLTGFGADIGHFRPGCGHFNSTLLAICDRQKYECVLGDVYAHDCHLPFPAFTAWHAKVRARSGSIIILHDGKKSRAINTAAVIRDIVPHFLSRGYKFQLLTVN